MLSVGCEEVIVSEGEYEEQDVQVVRANAERPRGPGLMTGLAGALPWFEILKSSCDMVVRVCVRV